MDTSPKHQNFVARTDGLNLALLTAFNTDLYSQIMLKGQELSMYTCGLECAV